jgi:hypothetical protein
MTLTSRWLLAQQDKQVTAQAFTTYLHCGALFHLENQIKLNNEFGFFPMPRTCSAMVI